MKRHADILAEYAGYKRACWYTIVCGLLMGAAALYTDLAAWPVAVLSVAEFGGGGLFILWKLRHIKLHVRQLEHPMPGTTRDIPATATRAYEVSRLLRGSVPPCATAVQSKIENPKSKMLPPR